MPRPPSSKYFKVFKVSSPNGKKGWKVEGRPTGQRERYYFATEKEARRAMLDLNNQIAAFGTQNNLTDAERVMSAECIKLLAPYGKTLYDAAHFLRDHLDSRNAGRWASYAGPRARPENPRPRTPSCARS
jgi:hypothetical protein